MFTKKLSLAGWLLCCGLLTDSAWAIKQFADEFDALYVTGNQDPAFVASVKLAKCNVCHVANKPKTERNAYGQELAKLLDKKVDIKNPMKIKEALEKVAALKPSGGTKTFGELIEAGFLPGDNK